ncbi:MAG: ABC transporter ATP-binding protein [Candidatus Cloacimonetes bacterium]|jgi:ATP-binding cassette subfamily B protein|nr:ABC transporter ATP-binding protein/permease [Candidatus Cloacimonadota bacterium]MDD4156976.1 ABC transporter ATP-binding protein [Candidatus Cloacimonadota bacterium]
MLKRFLKYYIPHKWLFILDMSVALLSAGITILIPTLTRNLLKTHIPQQNYQTIITILIIMLVIIMIKTLFTRIRIKWGHILGVRMEFDMREHFFRHLQKLSFSYFDNTKTGHLMSRISNDLNMIAEVAHHAPEDFLIAIVMIIGAFSVMFTFNTTLALLTLIPMPILLFWGIVFGGRMKQGFRNMRKSIAEMNSNVENSVQGIREVKSFANEHLEIEKFNDVNTHFKLTKEYMYGLMATFHSGMGFFQDFYYIWVIAGGAWLLAQGKIGLPDLLAFIMFITYILDPIQRLVNFMEQFQQGTASFERFIEIMDIEPEIEDKKNALCPDICHGNITINNISFNYPGHKPLVIKNVSMEIKSGKKIALVGESGAGKSTLISLIPRFYECSNGSIEVDNNNILNLKQKFLRNNIGIVQQNVFLFDTTIKDNILYGNPYSTDEEIIIASKKANIYDFIQSLPEKFDTLVGERGVKLSGGQKQRIAIARVFLKNPPILIFDEATSSLDNESEALIHQSMIELSKDRTTLIIAHRLSTVQNADLIYVMQKGEITEIGTHQELINNKSYYFSLYNKSFK